MNKLFLITLMLLTIVTTFDSASARNEKPIIEPDEIDIKIIQGRTKTVVVPIKNIWNESINGSIEILNVECPFCASAHLDYDKIDLKSNETTELTIHINAKRVKSDDLSLSIFIYPNEGNNRISQSYYNYQFTLNIQVDPNYPFWIGLSLFIILIIFIMVVVITQFRKKK